jgi:acetate kinase
MSILVINAGSTSLKFALFDAEAHGSLASGSIEWPDGNRANARMRLSAPGRPERWTAIALSDDHSAAVHAIAALAQEQPIELVGHRVVYGGTVFQRGQRIDPGVKAALYELCDLAPLHNPPALAAIEAAESALPGVPQVAVFDTAFFAQLPPRASVYPGPYEWYEKWGLRRIGFHGISNAYCASRVPELVSLPGASLRLITCHLGGGCSATAVRGGVPVTTTMGFTPIEGLMMGTRSGAVDPGLLLHLQRRCQLTADALDHALNYASGLLGVSGISADLGQIEAAARSGNTRAQLAFDMFADRVRSAIGSLAVTLGGVDAIVFTDRIGEGSAALRREVCRGLECLGARLDLARNEACAPDADIAAAESTVRILVIHTREEWMIAREAARALAGAQ